MKDHWVSAIEFEAQTSYIAGLLNVISPKPSIVTLMRGGLYVVSALVPKLNWVPYVCAISHYKDPLPVMNNFVVVDDILDTGQTIQLFSKAYGLSMDSVPCYFLYSKTGPHRLYEPPVYSFGKLLTAPPPIWVHFPWEKEGMVERSKNNTLLKSTNIN